MRLLKQPTEVAGPPGPLRGLIGPKRRGTNTSAKFTSAFVTLRITAGLMPRWKRASKACADGVPHQRAVGKWRRSNIGLAALRGLEGAATALALQGSGSTICAFIHEV